MAKDRRTITIDTSTYRLLAELGRVKGTYRISKTIRLLVLEELERLAKVSDEIKKRYEEYLKEATSRRWVR